MKRFTLLFTVIALMVTNYAHAQCEWPCTISCGNNKTSLCPGNPVVIGVSGCGLSTCKSGCTFSSVSWSHSAGSSCSVTVYPTTTTTYTLTVTLNGNCCADGATGSCNIPPGATCSTVQRVCSVTVTVNSSGCRIIGPDLLEDNNSSMLIVSPNPATDNVSVTLTPAGIELINLSKNTPLIALYDSNGKLISSQEWTSGANFVNLELVAKGVYFLRIIDGEDTVCIKKLIRN